MLTILFLLHCVLSSYLHTSVQKLALYLGCSCPLLRTTVAFNSWCSLISGELLGASSYGPGNGEVYTIDCSGNEMGLNECSNSTVTGNCSHIYDVDLNCFRKLFQHPGVVWCVVVGIVCVFGEVWVCVGGGGGGGGSVEPVCVNVCVKTGAGGCVPTTTSESWTLDSYTM